MSVNARHLLVKNKKSGVDELVDKVLADPSSPEALLYAKVLGYSTNSVKKQYIEGCLLASNDTTDISGALDLPEIEIVAYREFFYDVANLDRLSRLSLLSEGDKNENLFKMWAISQGLDFIRWRLGQNVQVSPIDGLRDLFTTCIYKSKEAMFNANDTEASKESTKYVKLSMDIARLLKVWVIDSEGAKRDLEVALKEVSPEFDSITTLGEESLIFGSIEDVNQAAEMNVTTNVSVGD